MAYYNRIASRWHRATGRKGGAFKEFVLNNVVLSQVPSVDRLSLLELGAGNGYFMPMLLERFSGQTPRRIVVSDISQKQLEVAQKQFWLPSAEYLKLDIRREFPFTDRSIDLILAVMVLNELSDGGVRRALHECKRCLSDSGILVIAVLHPRFIADLAKRRQLVKTGPLLTMPSVDGLRVPVVRRSEDKYSMLLEAEGLSITKTDVYADEKVLNAKPGLCASARLPLSQVLKCMHQNG